MYVAVDLLYLQACSLERDEVAVAKSHHESLLALPNIRVDRVAVWRIIGHCILT